MFPEQLKKILQLIKQTGDRVIIYDGANPDDPYVVMDVNHYLKTVTLNPHKNSEKDDFIEEKKEKTAPKSDLTDEDLTDKITSDKKLKFPIQMENDNSVANEVKIPKKNESSHDTPAKTKKRINKIAINKTNKNNLQKTFH